jgi:hypothetical protein
MSRTAFIRPSPQPHPLRAALAGALPAFAEQKADASSDLRLFLTAWLGGLVFFGTYLA